MVFFKWTIQNQNEFFKIQYAHNTGKYMFNIPWYKLITLTYHEYESNKLNILDCQFVISICNYKIVAINIYN